MLSFLKIRLKCYQWSYGREREAIRKRTDLLCNNLLKSKTFNWMDAEYNQSISFEHLLDSFIILFDECNNEFLMKDPLIAEFVDKFGNGVRKLRDLCINSTDFEIVKMISRGRFAEVSVVKEKVTKNVYVMKKLRKSDVLNTQDIHFDNEQNVMLLASGHTEARKWIPQLFYSFHDLAHMYFIMEYCPGGNLRTMLEYYKKNVPEPMLRFYIAEMIQAIHSIHSLGFVHRDIKPDNILVDVSGHLKLIDFGSSAKCTRNGQIFSKLPLNVPSYIPDYTAPEVFKFHESPAKGYSVHCDWWSLGIVIYELITGSVPFSRNEVGKLHQILNYSRKLQSQKLSTVSQDLKNIIFGLLQPVEKRLTYKNIIKLDYFNDLDWSCLRERDPPFVPSLTSPDDTSYCTTCEVQSFTPKTEDFKLPRRFTGRNLPFLGFTFMGNRAAEEIADDRSNFAPKIVGARRKTENLTKNVSEFIISDMQRHSMGETRNSGIASDCSNDSYQSTASVRLEKEVNQLHLFYNEKALTIEEKLKNSFHDMYNCMTGEQHKLLQEKDQLETKLKTKEEEFAIKIEELLSKNKQLENENAEIHKKLKDVTDLNDQLKKNHEEEINKFKKTDKLKKDAMNKMNSDMQKLKKELAETSEKLKETEVKLLSVSNQQAAKLAMARTTIRSRSVERNQYEQENVALKNQLAEAKKEINKLKTDLEKKNKMKLDFEVKMTTKDRNGERNFHAECKDDVLQVNKHNSEDLVHQIGNTMREVLKENLTNQDNTKKPDIEEMISAIQRKLSILSERCEISLNKNEEQPKSESNVIAILNSQIGRLESLLDETKQKADSQHKELTEVRKELAHSEKQLSDLKVELLVAQKENKASEERIKQLQNAITANNIVSTDLMKQFESTMKEILKENFLNKENVNKPDLENMLSTVHRRLSIISERCQLPKENIQFGNQKSIESSTVVFKTQIKRLESELENAKANVSLYRDLADQTKKELVDTEKQLTDLKVEHRVALNEVKSAQEQIKKLEAEKVDSVELMKQFENTMKDVRNLMQENMSNEENIKVTDLETMLRSVQRRLSILSERQPPAAEKQLSSEPPTIAVLESQIERLEAQLDKAKESAVLHREAATQAKNELALVQKQLADVKIDLRIAQREAKTAEEEVKELKRAKYIFYKELREEKQNLETQLQKYLKKLKESEELIEELKHTINEKDSKIAAKEMTLLEKSSVIQSLTEEVQILKTKTENYRQEKQKVESELKKRILETDSLKAKIEQLKNDLKTNKSDTTEFKQKEDALKTKYAEAEKTIISLKDTCEKLDILADSLEEDNRKFREENTKLTEQIANLKEELRNTRKMVNEEKSLKIFTENKLRSFEIELKKKEEEINTLEKELTAKQDYISSLENKNEQLEECLQSANASIEQCTKYTESMKNEIANLKKDRTELLTQQHRLKEENNSLRNELQEATDELNDLQQANGELQAVLAQVEAYHEIRHKTSDEILQQHSKLVDFLRTKFQDANKPKRTFADKLFRSKGKENLNPKEMENLLILERNKSKALTEQLYQAQIELKKLRGSENVSKCSSPKLNSDLDSCISRVGSSRNQQTSASTVTVSESEIPVNIRLKHNIPHKFETKKCKNRGYKCSSCNQSITMGQMMSRCKECHIWSHVPCSLKIGPTCGLSKALLAQFSAVNKYKVQSCSSVESNTKSDIEGSIKILRDKVWEKMTVHVEDDKLLLFANPSSQIEPKEQIPFSTIVNIDDNISYGEHFILKNISDTEKRCILRIIYRTPEREQKVLHMLALSEEDKVNWMNILRRNISDTQKQIAFNLKPDCFKGNVVCQFKKPNILNINQMIQISSEVSILSTNEGLFSLKWNLHLDAKPNNPVKITGVDKIRNMKALTKLRLALFICEEDDRVKKCDLRMLVCNAEAAQCSGPSITTTDVSNLICPLKNCKLVEVSSCNIFIAVATNSYLMILEWTEESYDLLKFKKKIPDVKCMTFSTHCLFIGTATEFFIVDLNTFEERKLNTLISNSDAERKQCLPETIVKITRELYLVCDKLFGAFVNAEGKRLKSTEMLAWPLPPHKIVYNKPFLCIEHESSVSLVYLPPTNEDSEDRFKFCTIDFHKPSILGVVKESARGVLIKDETEEDCKVYFLDPHAFMTRNPKQSWSSICTQSNGETTDEECIRKSLNISDETELSFNSSILENITE